MPNSLVHVVVEGDDALAPMVLLHGSGRDELELLSFGHHVAAERTLFALRGSVRVDTGYSFFRRNADGSPNAFELSKNAISLCANVESLCGSSPNGQKPIILGYSSGAIIAAASLYESPDLASAMVLMRPACPDRARSFPSLSGLPVLVVSGKGDPRRRADDHANVTDHTVSTGHEMSEQDITIVGGWLSQALGLAEQPRLHVHS